MTDFKAMVKIVNENKKRLNKLYEISFVKLDTADKDYQNAINDMFDATKLEKSTTNYIALKKRLLDLKDQSLKIALKEQNIDEKVLKDCYLIVKDFYEKNHTNLIQTIKQTCKISPFYSALLDMVHNVGCELNSAQIKWQKIIIDEGVESLKDFDFEEVLNLLSKKGFYQLDDKTKADRAYAAISDGENGVKKHIITKDLQGLENALDKCKFLAYSEVFFDEFKKIDEIISLFLVSTKPQNDDEKSYTLYIQKLKDAFMDTKDPIKAYQKCEIAWMDVKSPLQIGHFLEYYEDKFTHAVALEWDIRIDDEYEFCKDSFNKDLKKAFDSIYNLSGIINENAHRQTHQNIDKTQFHICTPMLFYAAELNGLFSAQVVPNDEKVSAKYGKKIFAFLNFVYESAKAKDFMKLSRLIFDDEFLKFGLFVLYKNEALWKKVYEITTIGHEGGHMFFMDLDTENVMNKSGVFKNIEEFKATSGGVYKYFFTDNKTSFMVDGEFKNYLKTYNIDETNILDMAVFYDIIKRAVGLNAWKKVDEVSAYYTEGLIFLKILFDSKVLSFDDKLSIDFSLDALDRFKLEFKNAYLKLAKTYLSKTDASEFLKEYCFSKDGYFESTHTRANEFSKHYHQMYEKYSNTLDESGDFEYFKA